MTNNDIAKEPREPLKCNRCGEVSNKQLVERIEHLEFMIDKLIDEGISVIKRIEKLEEKK